MSMVAPSLGPSISLPNATTPATTVFDNSPANKTFAYQNKLPKLPIPPIRDTCERYLRALAPLQDEKEHAATKKAVQEFLDEEGGEGSGIIGGGEGIKLDRMLREYAKDKDSYIEEFWSVSCVLIDGNITLTTTLGMSPTFRTAIQSSSPSTPSLFSSSSFAISSFYLTTDNLTGMILHPIAVPSSLELPPLSSRHWVSFMTCGQEFLNRTQCADSPWTWNSIGGSLERHGYPPM